MVGYFLKAFLSFTVMMLMTMAAGTVFKDLKTINFIFNVYPFFYFLGLSYFVMITIHIIGKPFLKKILFWVLIIWGVGISIIPTIEQKEALMVVQPPFVFWEDVRGSLMNNLIGVGLAVPILWFIFFFIYNGIRNRDEYVRKRSFLLSVGMTCFLIAGITDFIFGSNPNIFYVSIYTAFWGIVAAGFFIIAVEYKKEQLHFGEKE
jgi:hypothetical protein